MFNMTDNYCYLSRWHCNNEDFCICVYFVLFRRSKNSFDVPFSNHADFYISIGIKIVDLTFDLFSSDFAHIFFPDSVKLSILVKT